MEAAVLIILWLVSGVAGSALTMEFFWRRGSRPLDVDIADLGFFGLMSIFGPVNLAVGVLFLIGFLYRKAFRFTGIDTSQVVFGARRS